LASVTGASEKDVNENKVVEPLEELTGCLTVTYGTRVAVVASCLTHTHRLH